jgi:hypothetical protein
MWQLMEKMDMASKLCRCFVRYNTPCTISAALLYCSRLVFYLLPAASAAVDEEGRHGT